MLSSMGALRLLMGQVELLQNYWGLSKPKSVNKTSRVLKLVPCNSHSHCCPCRTLLDLCYQHFTLTKFMAGETDACLDGLAVAGRSAIQWLFSLLLNSYSSFDPHRLLIWVCAFTFVVTVQEGITTGTWHILCIPKFSVVAALCHVIVAESLSAKTFLFPKAQVPVFPLSARYCFQQLKARSCFQTRLLLVPNF